MKPTTSPTAPDAYEFDGFRLEPARRLLWHGDAQVPLTPRVFDTLLYLVEQRDVVLDKERLMEALWPDAVVEENNLTQNISTLRRVFGEKPGSHRFIVTVPGRGYRFVAGVRPRQAQAEADTARSEEAAAVPLTSQPEHLPSTAYLEPAGRRNFKTIAVAMACVLTLLAASWLIWRGQTPREIVKPPSAPTVLPEKSIAVLPFTNLSSEKENAFFTEGVQEDILTALAKVADLKVISRTSVVSYVAGPGCDLREIARELGVKNILEGSVRREGGKVRVTAQLIETQTNTHLWAETYDRQLTDVFAIQSDIARQIAAALKAKLAPGEKVLLEERPTTNPEAYILYLTALGREGAVNSSKDDAMAAEQLYMQAATLDPGFALAYARASIINSGFSTAVQGDHRARKAKARVQAEEALRLSPTLSEAHTALGLCLSWGDKKYDEALQQFEAAAASSPNNAEICLYLASIYRRQGRWRDSILSFERSVSLDPRNRRNAFLAGNHYGLVRDWTAATASYKRALEIAPDFMLPKVGLAYLEVCRNGNPGAGRKILQDISAAVALDETVKRALWDLTMMERDFAGAEKLVFDSEDFPRELYQGRTALARGDNESAQRFFSAASAELEKRLRDDPSLAERHARIGLLYAYMQKKEDAIREARKAVELEPENQNAFHGALRSANLAMVYALLGEADQAIPLIERLVSTPGAVEWPDFPSSMSVAELRLRWEWDGLRKDPRFQKILAGLEPKTNY